MGMTFLEYLDRIGERRAARPIRPPRDIRQLIGAMFLAGYYLLVWQLARQSLPADNVGLIRDAMLTLGPPIGIIIGAMFRSDAREEQQTANTGEALRTIGKVAEAGGTGTGAAQAAADRTADAAVDEAAAISGESRR